MDTAVGRASGRTLHLVDLENLAGDATVDGPVALRVMDRYLDVAGWREGDLVYVATNPALAGRIFWDMPVGCSFRTACGRDGADHALLSEAAAEFVARRFERLVIGSGDHIFIRRALAVRNLGVGVVVVSRAASAHSGWRAHGFPVLALDDRVPAPVSALPRTSSGPRPRPRRSEPLRAA